MTLFSSIAVVVGVIATLNLLLTLGVVRRLREHSERLSTLATSGVDGTPGELPLSPGERPSEFTAITVDGQEISLSTLTSRRTLVGFFMADCPPCKQWVPRFVEAAKTAPHGRSQALAVVAGRGAEADELIAELNGVALVVAEDGQGPVAKAFAVEGFPAMCLLDEDGTVATNLMRRVVDEPLGA